MEVLSSSNLREHMKVNSLSIADSGKGKTYFAGSIAKYGNPFIIDAEDGLMTAANLDFDYVRANSFPEFKEAINLYLNTYADKGYTHLVVDSITRLQQYLVYETNKTGKLSQSEWGTVLGTLRVTIDWLTKNCPTHLHMTAMAMESRDELTGMTKIYPNIQGAFRYDLAGYFDVVLYHDCKVDAEGNTEYYVQTQGDQRITARSRLDSIQKLNRYEQNDYKIIANIIAKHKGESNE